jgi:two-component system nitrogen regulation response regulator NtrX
VGKGSEIVPQDLPFFKQGVTEERGPKLKSLKDREKLYILQTLEENEWNISRTAEELGIDRVTLYNKIKKYNLEKSKTE